MEGDAGASRLNPTDAEDAPDDSVAVSEQEQTGHEHQDNLATEQVAEGVDRRRHGWAAAGWPGSARLVVLRLPRSWAASC